MLQNAYEYFAIMNKAHLQDTDRLSDVLALWIIYSRTQRWVC